MECHIDTRKKNGTSTELEHDEFTLTSLMTEQAK